MNNRQYSSYLIGAIVLMGLMLLIITGCDNDDPTGPEDQEVTPTPVSTYSASYQLMLAPRETGLYCWDESTEKLMVPWPMAVGQEFESAVPYCGIPVVSSVISTGGTYNCDAGSFEDVIQINTSVRNVVFKTEIGFLDLSIQGMSRGYTNTTLRSYSVNPGEDSIANRFGLASGNRWEYKISGIDSNGEYRIEGSESRHCSGKTVVSGQDVFLVDVEIQTATYSLVSAGQGKCPLNSRNRTVDIPKSDILLNSGR